MRDMFVSIIIPALNEEVFIGALLHQLQPYRKLGHEVIIVDGGSDDKTVSISNLFADKVIQFQPPTPPSRALQMNNGAAQASFDILWFLHADTLLPDNSIEKIQFYLVNNKCDWGRFNIKLSGRNILFRLVEKMINIRSCFTGIATGDQGIFVTRKSFDAVKGYSNIPLMEDIDLSRKLKKLSNPVCIKEKLTTSTRRWERKGIISTILLMWRLRFLYWIGVSADKLASQYR